MNSTIEIVLRASRGVVGALKRVEAHGGAGSAALVADLMTR